MKERSINLAHHQKHKRIRKNEIRILSFLVDKFDNALLEIASQLSVCVCVCLVISIVFSDPPNPMCVCVISIVLSDTPNLNQSMSCKHMQMHFLCGQKKCQM